MPPAVHAVSGSIGFEDRDDDGDLRELTEVATTDLLLYLAPPSRIAIKPKGAPPFGPLPDICGKP
jgi:hypothetical protein